MNLWQSKDHMKVWMMRLLRLCICIKYFSALKKFYWETSFWDAERGNFHLLRKCYLNFRENCAENVLLWSCLLQFQDSWQRICMRALFDWRIISNECCLEVTENYQASLWLTCFKISLLLHLFNTQISMVDHVESGQCRWHHLSLVRVRDV